MALIQVKDYTTKIPLGKQGENCNRIQFSLSNWQMQYGDGHPVLIHKRKGDAVAYPVELQVEEAAAYWDVQTVDTEKPGLGKCEITYYADNGKVSKSITYQTSVEESMNAEVGYEPQEVPNWMDMIGKAVASANAATQEALEAAKVANEAAGNISGDDTPGDTGNEENNPPEDTGGSGEEDSSGEVADEDVATDEEVDEMLDEIFGTGANPENS